MTENRVVALRQKGAIDIVVRPNSRAVFDRGSIRP
jgi:hypothetical protein